MVKKNGRPSKFNPELCKQVTKLCRLGAVDKELADFFSISESTLNNWKKDHPEFMESIKEGKEIADSMVGDRLYERATGYSHVDTHFSNYQGKVTATSMIKHYAPDTTACIFWLKNRRPDLWRDRHEITGADGGPVSVAIVDPTRAED